MLVLVRKESETIAIDPHNCPLDELGRIVVTVVRIEGNKVRMGIKAPRRVRVLRGEIAPPEPPIPAKGAAA